MNAAGKFSGRQRLTALLLAVLLCQASSAGDADAKNLSSNRLLLADSLVEGRYTIQLLALPERQALEAFVLASGISGLMAKQVERNGEKHYVLFTGSFTDRAEALAAVDELPSALAELTPWVRPLDPLLK